MASAIPEIAKKAFGNIFGELLVGGAAASVMLAVAGSASNAKGNSNYYLNSLTTFPSDLPSIGGTMPSLMLSFFSYQRPSILLPPTLSAIGSIALPLPANMVDRSSMSYSEESGATAVNAGLEQLAISGNQTIASVSMQLAEQALKVGGAAAEQAAFNATSAAAAQAGDPKAQAKLLQFAGLAQNQFLSVMFNSPTFKRHEFQWTFIPESPQDSEVLNFIFNKLRVHHYPSVNSTTGGVLLGYPDMCVPVIVPQGYFYSFKQCVIEGVAIDYAPNGPSMTTLNAPNAVTLGLKLLEIEYWSSGDITGTGANFGVGSSLGPYMSNK